MFICPKCKSVKLTNTTFQLRCELCGEYYEIKDGIVCFIKEFNEYQNNTIQLYEKIHKQFEKNNYGKFIKYMNFGYSKEINDSEPLFITHALINQNAIRLFYKLTRGKSFSGKRILEIGCGRGGNIEFLNKMNEDIQIWGVDLSFRGLSCIKQRHNINLCVSDINTEFPFCNDFFQDIFCIEVLHNIDDFYNVLKECYRILGQGCIYIADVLYDNQWKIFFAIAHSLGYIVQRNEDISNNVVLSNMEVSNNRISLLGNDSANMIGSEGSRFFKELENKTLQYRLVELRKL